MLDQKIMFAMNGTEDAYLEEAAVRLGYIEQNGTKTGFRNRKKLFGTILAAAAICVLLTASAVAISGWYTKTFVIDDSPALQQMAEKAVEDASRFAGKDAEGAGRGPAAEYETGDRGQSGTYLFFTTNAIISYYESGEIHMLDAREHSDPNPAQDAEQWENPYASFFAEEEELHAYARQLEAIAPAVLDALYSDGWIGGNGEEAAKYWCNDVYGVDTVFNGPSAVVCVLMNDDTAYELWLNPQTFVCEGFMFFKAEDMPNTRNGKFLAMKNGTEEKWMYEINHDPAALG